MSLCVCGGGAGGWVFRKDSPRKQLTFRWDLKGWTEIRHPLSFISKYLMSTLCTRLCDKAFQVQS